MRYVLEDSQIELLKNGGSVTKRYRRIPLCKNQLVEVCGQKFDNWLVAQVSEVVISQIGKGKRRPQWQSDVTFFHNAAQTPTDAPVATFNHPNPSTISEFYK